MSNQLIQLPEFSYTSLDFDTIIDDIKTLIKEHPEYNNEWNDFLETNAGRMFVEMMSFIVEKLASRLDWSAQEMFVSTATQRQSLINILKLINHRPALPRASKVNIKGKVTKWASPFALPQREKIIGLDLNGNPARFELIEMADDGKPDYDYQYIMNTGDTDDRVTEIFNIPFYHGVTYIEDDIYMEGIDNETYTLEQYPIIENSVRVYRYNTGEESAEVDSYISTDAQQNDLSTSEKIPPYMIEIDSDNKATIKFGPSFLVKTPVKGERFKFIYRVGGGIKSNAVSGSINTTKTYTLPGDKRVSVIFSNPDAGFGGTDEEDLEQAKLTAPISLRSANKTVTNEDYVYHLEDSPYVLHASIIGKENEPDEIVEEYGYHLPPLDSWIYITPNRDNWESKDPITFNKIMQVSRPYDVHDIVDYEDISITTSNQKAYLKNYRQYAGYQVYVTLVDNLTAEPYVTDTDFTLNPLDKSIERISTADGGSIPAGDVTMRVRYVTDDTPEQFYSNTVFTLNSEIFLDTVESGLYPAHEITVFGTDGRLYVEDTDYSIDYTANKITRIEGAAIQMGDSIQVYYANHWSTVTSDSEEGLILDEISDKKMICVDNYIKDSVYTPFDIVATVYCYKNMKTTIESDLKPYLRSLYNLENGQCENSISKGDIFADIIKFDGVKSADINYLGKDYEAYRRYVLDIIDQDTLNDMDANKVENTIPAKYNEMLIVSDDAYEGSEIIENQRNGIILEFKDV